MIEERTQIPARGQIDSGTSNQNRIQDVTDEEQKERDKLYEERMEDEYAKREGGA